jgi:hypothetical protein
MHLTNLHAEFLPKLSQSLVSLVEFFGLSTGSSLLSAQGLFSAIAILGTFFLFRTVLKSFGQTEIQNNMTVKLVEYQYIPIFFIVSVISNIFIFIIVDEGITGRYFIPFMVLYIPLAAILFEHAEKQFDHLKRITLISGIILFIFGQSYLNFQSMARFDVNSARKNYIKYLSDNKLEYGFATFMNANVTTELTNGQIVMAGLNPDGLEPYQNQFRIHNWASLVKHSNPSFHLGESFLLLTRAEWELAQKMGRPFAQLHPDYEDNYFVVKRYPSAEIIHREVLDN